jgi:hypothetical protein
MHSPGKHHWNPPRERKEAFGIEASRIFTGRRGEAAPIRPTKAALRALLYSIVFTPQAKAGGVGAPARGYPGSNGA